MSDRVIKFLLSGILLCLIIIAFRMGKPPVINNIPSPGNQNMFIQDTNYSYQVIPLSDNKLAVIRKNNNEMKVFEYRQDKGMYVLIGYFDPYNASTYDVMLAK